ncbi:putative RING finger protein [Escovopsis weberi]|uniref:Putative RING finger protein n=1 Tax=Escovopsis weberi TaxID=150374 RepID=A0A0N0RTW1_ESCWE|nr:putative RING finger protein [Escovopsis weberi]
MSSSVFFKFKSQKEPTRVEFDGTGISVFELKREIINKSGLGDGTDFDLFIYTDDGSEEYDDDTTIVPRSTTVIARRQPAVKPGAGRAARYVSGKMPVAAKNAGRKEQAAKAAAAKASTSAISQMNDAMTEEDRMAAMFAAQSEQWTAQQEELSHQAPIFKPSAKRPANVPDHDPPNGYICYRCGNKGHWIQLCPTNDDPDFDNRPRVKRTTGIPRSFLQKVDKSVVLAQSDGDESKRPNGIMVNAEGDFVIAEPDKASWEQFQAKAKTSVAAKTAQTEDQELKERGLECFIDKKMFIEPMKTPCCQKTFCNDCIVNALIESDFICPACQTEGVLIDDLRPDEEMSKTMQDYLKEKQNAKSSPLASPKGQNEPSDPTTGKPNENDETIGEKKSDAPAAKEKSKSPTVQSAMAATASTASSSSSSSAAAAAAQKSPTTGSASVAAIPQPADSKALEVAKTGEASVVKKRPAEDFLENPKIPKGPRAMQNQQNQNMMHVSSGMGNMSMPNMMFDNGMGMMSNMMGMGMGMGNMNMPMSMGMGMPMGMPMGMGSGMGMPMNMGMSMMGMPGMGMQGGFGGSMNSGFGGDMQGGYGGGSNMNMNMNMNGNWGMNAQMGGMNGGGMGGFQNGNFQQDNTGEEDAYFRKPVNPHRHQNKQRRVRPSDYREL